MNIFGQVNRPAFCNLQDGSEAFDQVQAAHRHRHTAPGQETARVAAAPEVTRICRIPGGGFKAFLCLGRGNLPPGFDGRLTIDLMPAGGVKRTGAGVDQVDHATRGMSA
jgi:hypothetical protein